jgi:hypothetical protein
MIKYTTLVCPGAGAGAGSRNRSRNFSIRLRLQPKVSAPGRLRLRNPAGDDGAGEDRSGAVS